VSGYGFQNGFQDGFQRTLLTDPVVTAKDEGGVGPDDFVDYALTDDDEAVLDMYFLTL